MAQFTLHLRQAPHFRISAHELADWLAQQPKDSWWSVDGDHTLMERLGFPCPAEDLADELKRIDRTLLLLDSRKEPTASGETISSGRLDEIAFVDKRGDRAFQFCWEDCEYRTDEDWILLEDKEIGRLSLGLDDTAE